MSVNFNRNIFFKFNDWILGESDKANWNTNVSLAAHNGAALCFCLRSEPDGGLENKMLWRAIVLNVEFSWIIDSVLRQSPNA